MTVLEPLTREPAFESSCLAWGNYGWAQVLAGKVDERIESLKSAVTEPRFCAGHYRLGIAYEKKGDVSAAETSSAAPSTSTRPSARPCRMHGRSWRRCA
jgi:hypothetical protein